MTSKKLLRPLTELEIGILNKLLSREFHGVNELKAQIGDTSAISTKDTDNYGSILLSTTSTHKAQVQSRVPVEATFNDEDGVPVIILLHVVDGFVNELEIVKGDGLPLIGPINPENLTL
jgi:hypothetical protein